MWFRRLNWKLDVTCIIFWCLEATFHYLWNTQLVPISFDIKSKCDFCPLKYILFQFSNPLGSDRSNYNTSHRASAYIKLTHNLIKTKCSTLSVFRLWTSYFTLNFKYKDNIVSFDLPTEWWCWITEACGYLMWPKWMLGSIHV